MPRLLTEETLRTAVAQQTFIRYGSSAAVEGIKIDLHMSGRVLKAAFSQPINLSELSASERSGLQIDPGEVVFVLTKEELALPFNILASLTPKRTLAHSGIVVLGGLAVDPGYQGRLWLGLYNVSTTAYPIHEGKKLISALFYELSEAEPVASRPVGQPLNDFPDELVTLIRNYRPVELSGVHDALEKLDRDVVALKADFSSDRTWRDDLKNAVEKYGKQVEATGEQLKTLSGLLEKEGEVRRKGDDDLAESLKKVSEKAVEWATWRTVTGGLVLILASLVLGALFSPLIPKQPIAPPAPTVVYFPAGSNTPIAATPATAPPPTAPRRTP